MTSTQPTTTEEGIRTYTCTRCNSSYTESIAKLPEEQHTYNYTESIPTTGHSYTQPIAKIKADDSSRNQGRDNGNANQNLKSDATNGTENRNTNSEHNKSGISNGNENGQSNTEQKKADTEVKPYIKDDSGKEGWDVIKPQLEEAKSGDTVTVTMNGTTVVPKDVIESIKGKDTILVLNMGNGLSWKINGKNITAPAGDIDFGVTIGADAGKTIPVDVINNVTGKRSFMNLTLAYDGEFGFTATLTVNMETKNAGLYANLFYYNEQLGKLEFVSAGQIDSYGNVEIAFTHASDYAIVIDAAVMDGEKDYACNSTIIIIIGICILLIVFGTVIFVRKKSGSEEE